MYKKYGHLLNIPKGEGNLLKLNPLNSIYKKKRYNLCP